MKAYFINPPAANGVAIVREGRCMQRQGAWTAVWAPISLALLASALRNEQWQVALSDCIVENISFDVLEAKVRAFQPDLVVINVVTPSLDSDLSTCRAVKKAFPRAVTAAIGIHPSVLAEECLAREPALDYAVRGEPELTVKELAAALKNNAGPAGITGLSYRSGGTVVHEQDRTPLQDLDELPLPAWDLVAREKYILPFTDRPFLLIATSRGCPYSCAFCADAAFYGKKLRLRSPRRIVDELAWVKKTFGISEFLFWSESFTINREFCTAVAREIIDRKIGVSWVCNSRVDHVTPELLRHFKEAGCWMIGYGIESGSQDILNSMRKGITLEQIARAVTASHDAGLEVTGHCVIGYPGETKETIRQTIAMTKRLPFDFVQYYCSVPFPGSELYLEAKKAGWIVSDDWSRFEQNFSVMTTPSLSADEVMEWRKRAYRQFYVSPRAVVNVLRKVRGAKDVANLFRMTKDFLTWVK